MNDRCPSPRPSADGPAEANSDGAREPGPLPVLVMLPAASCDTGIPALLGAHGIATTLCTDIDALVRRMEGDVGAVVLGETALDQAAVARLSDWIGDQDDWSALPIVLLADRAHLVSGSPLLASCVDRLGNVTLLEEDCLPATLLSVIRCARRSRERQYLARGRLDALRVSDARFRATFENAAVGVAHVAPDGRWLRVNDTLCAILGYERTELARRCFQDVTHPDDLAGDLVLVERLLAGEIPSYRLEKRYIRKDGSVVDVQITVSLMRGTDGTPDYFIVVVEDIGRRKEAEAALKRNEERFRALAMLGADWFWEQDAAHRFTTFSGAAASIWTEGVEARIGRTRWDAPDAGAEEAFWRAHRDTLDAHRPFRDFVFRRVLADGRVVWISTSGDPVFDENGTFTGYRGSARDVTLEKEAEKRQELMWREMGHRIKNLFAMIQSMARQTWRTTTDRDAFLSEFDDRLCGLQRAHALLSGRSWRSADLRTLATTQLEIFFAAADRRLHLDGPEVRLQASRATSLGMIFHELGTNASKYGALSNETGSIALSWRIDGDRLHLTWREKDGPRVAPPTRHGFGTRLLQASADVEMRYDESGFACDIVVELHAETS